MRRNILLWAIFLWTLLFHIVPDSSKALGPWKAQVVDVEMKKPLEGVVVIAVWSKVFPRSGGVSFLYVDSEEAVSDKDGRFSIAARNFSTIDPLILEEPEFFFFKPGYGQWRFHGEEVWLKIDPRERRKYYEEAGKQFESEGVVIEMPRLKTHEERFQFYQSLSRPGNLPSDRMKHWNNAESVERGYLGL